jgi:hypothetical protein
MQRRELHFLGSADTAAWVRLTVCVFVGMPQTAKPQKEPHRDNASFLVLSAVTRPGASRLFLQNRYGRAQGRIDPHMERQQCRSPRAAYASAILLVNVIGRRPRSPVRIGTKVS